jgi:hypothetical protein
MILGIFIFFVFKVPSMRLDTGKRAPGPELFCFLLNQVRGVAAFRRRAGQVFFRPPAKLNQGQRVTGKIRKQSETLTRSCLNKIQQQIHHQQMGEKKRALLHQRPVVIWMTGLPAAGKSTLASRLEDCLVEKGYLTHWLDGDDLRSGLTSDLGFTETWASPSPTSRKISVAVRK